ncbi:TPA: cobalamin biosynthesis protein CbiM [bacterium]|nr:cobalamin biosynthesis protein CbiM [bacterium]
MHIPDGFLTVNTCVSTWLISVASIGYCLKRIALKLEERMIPTIGVTSAFIFAAQMLNFPVIGGTSGHLMGGVLAAVLLGPYAGAIVISLVLIVQCLIFQDGGLTALGANILNMAILGSSGGYLIYKLIKVISKNMMVAVALASWLSIVIASLACAVELGISGISPFKIVIPAMVGIHALIGIGEAIISCLVIDFVLKVRPDLIYKGEREL